MTAYKPDEEYMAESDLKQHVKDLLGMSPDDESKNYDVDTIISKRINALKYSRAEIRAEKYVEKYPNPESNRDKERKRLDAFLETSNWPNVTDVTKILEGAERLHSSKGSRRLRSKFNPNLELKHYKHPSKGQAFEISLNSQCETQEWRGICDVIFPGSMGRGIMSTEHFQQGDVICDYHGISVTSHRNAYDYCAEDPDRRNSTFVLEVLTRPQRLIDATSEKCPVHEHLGPIRCMARLCNHASQQTISRSSNAVCNMKLVETRLDHLTGKPRHAILVATRAIKPFEQLRFDYNDSEAQKSFTE